MTDRSGMRRVGGWDALSALDREGVRARLSSRVRCGEKRQEGRKGASIPR